MLVTPVHPLYAVIWPQGPHAHCRALFASTRPHINSPFSSLSENLPMAYSSRRSNRMDWLALDQPTQKRISVAVVVHILQRTDLGAKLMCSSWDSRERNLGRRQATHLSSTAPQTHELFCLVMFYDSLRS